MANIKSWQYKVIAESQFGQESKGFVCPYYNYCISPEMAINLNNRMMLDFKFCPSCGKELYGLSKENITIKKYGMLFNTVIIPILEEIGGYNK